MNPLIVKNLKKSFKERGKTVKAVDGLSFEVREGEIFGLLGANGAGKSTTINMLNGLVSKDAGEIRILGKDPEKDWEAVRPNVNVATAYYRLSFLLTVRKNLRIYAKLYGVENPEQRIDELLKEFKLSHLADRKTSKLSSGEHSRLLLCKGLINHPKVLFLDECTSGLDPDIAESTRKIIKQYQKKHNTTILFTSHYMYEVEELCDRIAFMRDGKILKIGTSHQLKKMIKQHTLELKVIKKLPQLKKLLENEKIEILSARNNTIIFEARADNRDVYKVLNKIFSAGVQLSDLHIKRPTLDDIFIKIARSK